VRTNLSFCRLSHRCRTADAEVCTFWHRTCAW
jgi:hypothetical protein